MKKLQRTLFSVLACLWASQASAMQLDYYTEMDGPQVNSGQPGTGWGEFVIDTAANTFDFHIEHMGMVNAESAAHIHGPAGPGQEGPIEFFLNVGSPKIGTWVYPEAIEADLLAGLFYINIHSHEVLSGEMRGQILPRPAIYCDCSVAPTCANPDPNAGCANSTGMGAWVGHTGLASTTLDTFSPRAENLPPNQFGLFYMGQTSPSLPFGDGMRCVGGGTVRLDVVLSDASGLLTQPPGVVAQTAPSIDPGETWFMQCWYRDPGGPCGAAFNLSDALAVPFTL